MPSNGCQSFLLLCWRKRPAKIISADELQLYRRAKALFESSRNSLGSKTLSKKLCEKGLQVGRYRTRTIMRKLGLKVRQRVAYKVTTKRKHSDRVADNLLNQNFNPLSEDEVWAGDITYLRTHEGWMYLAIVGACWDKAVVERFFGSLKHDWILKVTQPTREHVKLDVAQYIRYYNTDRSHTANGNLSPVKYELSQLKVSGIG